MPIPAGPRRTPENPPVPPSGLTRRAFVRAAAVASAATAWACGVGAALAQEPPATFSDGNLLYSVLDAEARTVAVGTGAQPETGRAGDGVLDPSQEDVVVPATVTNAGAEYAVVQIAPYAFTLCDLRRVQLPEGLVKIAKGAFSFCRRLEAVQVPSTVTLISSLAFFAAGSLAEVTFAEPSQLKEIGDGAFAIDKTSGSPDNPDTSCSLAAIELPQSLHLLGSYAFFGQRALASVVFRGETLNEISPYTFGHCTALTRIDLPTMTSTIERIGRFAFADDTALAIVTFQGGVDGTQTTQAGNEFAGCSAIETVVYYQKKWNATNNGMNPPPMSGFFVAGPTGNTVAGSGRTAEVIGASFSFGTGGFTDSPDAREYYTVRQYATEADALAGADPLGWAVIPAGTPLHSVCAATCQTWEQRDFAAGAWTFESGYRPCDGLADTLWAIPCDPADLGNAGMLVDAPTGDDGVPSLTLDVALRGVDVTVWDAAGNELVQGTDYELACTDALGADADPRSIDASGSYVLTAVGCGDYSGELSCDIVVGDAPSRWFRLATTGWQATQKSAAEAAFANASSAQTPCDWAFVVPAGEAHAELALSACALAGAFGAPVLLTEPQSLTEEVAYQINRIGAHTVVIIGDEACVSLDAEDALAGLYVVDKVYRIAGADDAETIARIVQLGPSLGMFWSDMCIVAAHGNIAGALPAAALANWYVAPIVWATDEGIPQAQLTALADARMARAVVVGAQGTVPGAVDAQLADASVSVERVEGADPEQAAASVARYSAELGMGVSGAVVTTPDSATDKAPLAVLAGHTGSVLLYAGDEALAFIAEHPGEVARGHIAASADEIGDDEIALLEAVY